MGYRITKYLIDAPHPHEEIQCQVCGSGIEEDKVTETAITVINYVSEGTVWHNADPSKIDRKVTVTVPSNTNCWLCGSNRFRNGGRRGSL